MRHCGKDFDFHVENLKPKPNRYHFIDDSEGLTDKNLQFDLFRQTKHFSTMNPVFHMQEETANRGSFPLNMFLLWTFTAKPHSPTSLPKALCLQLPASKLLH